MVVFWSREKWVKWWRDREGAVTDRAGTSRRQLPQTHHLLHPHGQQLLLWWPKPSSQSWWRTSRGQGPQALAASSTARLVDFYLFKFTGHMPRTSVSSLNFSQNFEVKKSKLKIFNRWSVMHHWLRLPQEQNHKGLTNYRVEPVKDWWGWLWGCTFQTTLSKHVASQGLGGHAESLVSYALALQGDILSLSIKANHWMHMEQVYR